MSKRQGHKKFKDHRSQQKYEDKPDKQIDFPVKLCMWYFDQCDPKRCSGMILKKHGYLSTLSKSAKFNGIVLTPTASKVISPEDREILLKLAVINFWIETSGLCVIDCSWQFFDSVKVKSIKKNERLLPYMLASNPVNYGKEIKLNLQSYFIILFLSGFQDEAEEVMSVFKWGGAFFFLNEIYFDKYVRANTSDEMMKAEEEMMIELEKLREETRQQRNDFDMLPSSSDEDEEEQVDQNNDDKEQEEEVKKEEEDSKQLVVNQDEEEKKGKEEEENKKDDQDEELDEMEKMRRNRIKKWELSKLESKQEKLKKNKHAQEDDDEEDSDEDEEEVKDDNNDVEENKSDDEDGSGDDDSDEDTRQKRLKDLKQKMKKMKVKPPKKSKNQEDSN